MQVKPVRIPAPRFITVHDIIRAVIYYIPVRPGHLPAFIRLVSKSTQRDVHKTHCKVKIAPCRIKYSRADIYFLRIVIIHIRLTIQNVFSFL